MALKRSTRIWLEGAIRSCATGISAVLVVNVVDPHDFGVLSNFGKVAALAVLMAAVQFVQFLTQRPLPNPDDDSPDQLVTRTMPLTHVVDAIKGTGDGTK